MKAFTRRYKGSEFGHLHTLIIEITFLDSGAFGGSTGYQRVTSCAEIFTEHKGNRIRCHESNHCEDDVIFTDSDDEEVLRLTGDTNGLWREVAAFEDGLWSMLIAMGEANFHKEFNL